MKIPALLLLTFASMTLLATDPIEAAIKHEGRSEADQARDLRSHPGQLLKFSGVTSGMKVADMFSAHGYYSELLSYIVGDQGKVYAHNNQPYLQFIGKEKVLARYEGRLPNVELLHTEVDSLGLPSQGLDMIFMVMTYHDLYHTSDNWPQIDPKDFLNQILQSLKPGGHLLIVDHQAAEGRAQRDAQRLHRIEKSYALKDLAGAGFELVKESDMLHNPDDNTTISVFNPTVRGKTDRFVLLFRKPK